MQPLINPRTLEEARKEFNQLLIQADEHINQLFNLDSNSGNLVPLIREVYDLTILVDHTNDLEVVEKAVDTLSYFLGR